MFLFQKLIVSINLLTVVVNHLCKIDSEVSLRKTEKDQQEKNIIVDTDFSFINVKNSSS